MRWEEFAKNLYEKRDELQERAKKTKFKCLKKCGYICCSETSLVFTPLDVDEEVLLTALAKPLALIPMLGSQSKVPILYKPPGVLCPFYSHELGCTIYEKRPNACRFFPAGRIMGEKGEEYIVVPEDVCCPEEAFREGEPLYDMVQKEKEIAEEKTRKIMRFSTRYTKEIAPKIPHVSGHEEQILAIVMLKIVVDAGNPDRAITNLKRSLPSLLKKLGMRGGGSK